MKETAACSLCPPVRPHKEVVTCAPSKMAAPPAKERPQGGPPSLAPLPWTSCRMNSKKANFCCLSRLVNCILLRQLEMTSAETKRRKSPTKSQTHAHFQIFLFKCGPVLFPGHWYFQKVLQVNLLCNQV